MSGYIFNSGHTNTLVFNLTPANNSIVLPAGRYCNNLLVFPESEELIDVSDVSNGGTEIEEQFPAAAGISSNIIIETYNDTDTTIYFANLTGNITVTAYFL